MSCSKESSNMAVEKNPRVTMNFYQKTMSSSYHIKNIMRIIHRGNLYQYICTGENAFRCCYFWKFIGFSGNVNPAMKTIVFAYIYKLTKFGDFMSCGLKNIIKNVPCLMC